MQLFAASPLDGDEVRGFEQCQVLRDALPRHVEVVAELAQRLPVARMQSVEELAAPGIGERFEETVICVAHAHALCK